MSEDLDLSTEADETQEVSMDDTIRQALADIESRNDAVDDEEDVDTSDSRTRDEKGRFAKAESDSEQVSADAPADGPEAAMAASESIAEPPAEPAPVSVPPELQKLGLRKDEAEAIAKDPVALQAFMRRSEEMHRGIEQYRTKAQFGEQMERAIAPFAPVLQQMGVSPEFAVQRLLTAENHLRNGSPQQKVAMLAQLARDYGVDISNFTEQAASLPTVDPQVQTLQSQLQQMQAWIQQQNQAAEWQQRETLNSEISRFKSDPAHVYFEEVRDDMAGLLQAGLAPDLKTAYEKAIYANPAIRARVLAEQQAAAEATRKAEADRKAQQARSAAAVNLPRKGKAPAAKPIGSMDDTIREKAREMGLIS